MKVSVSLVLVFAAAAWAQAPAKPNDPMAKAAEGAKAAVEKAHAGQPAPTPAPKPATPAVPDLMTLAPATLIATVNGRNVTAGDLQLALRNMPPQVRQQATADRRAFVQQYGMMLRLSDLAEKAKLDQADPWKDMLAYQRMMLLTQAYLTTKNAEAVVTEEEQKKTYEAQKDQFAQANTKAIYLPYGNAPAKPDADPKAPKPLTEVEAQTKADAIVKQARAGADFVKLVKENSGDPTTVAKDGDMPLHKNALPEDMKKAIFAAKPGEVVGPFKQPRGFYIFKVVDFGIQPLDEVRVQIANQIKEQQFAAWMKTLQESIEVKMADQASVAPSATQPAAPAPAK